MTIPSILAQWDWGMLPYKVGVQVGKDLTKMNLLLFKLSVRPRLVHQVNIFSSSMTTLFPEW